MSRMKLWLRGGTAIALLFALGMVLGLLPGTSTVALARDGSLVFSGLTMNQVIDASNSDVAITNDITGTNGKGVYAIISDEVVQMGYTGVPAGDTFTLSGGRYEVIECTVGNANCYFTFKPDAVKYPVWVGGTQVTSENAEDTTGTRGWSYNADTNTLRLNNYTYEGSGYQYGSSFYVGILYDNYNGPVPLTIELEGENIINNTFTSTEYACAYGLYISAEEPAVITGTGSLNVSATGFVPGTSDGISARSITIKDTTVTASGLYSGVSSGLTIQNSTVTATGESWAGVSSTAEIDATSNVVAIGGTHAFSGTVKNAVVGTGWTDAEGTQGKAEIAVNTDGQSLETYNYKKVQFPAVYPVWVGGTQVNVANASDVFEDGTVSYTPAVTDGTELVAPATLTLNGYSNADGYQCGESERAAIFAEQDLTIELMGTNEVKKTGDQDGRWYGVAVFGGNLTIEGDGSLETSDTLHTGVIVTGWSGSAGEVTIDGGTVTAHGQQDGIAAYGNEGRGRVTVGGSAIVEARTSDVSNGAGIKASSAVTIGGDATVVAAGGNYGIDASGGVSITDGKVLATGKNWGIYAIANGIPGLSITGGEVVASATGEECFGTFTSSEGVYVGDGVVSFVSSGAGGAFHGDVSVKNAVPGTGWSDVEGNEGKEAIDVSNVGQTLAHRKVQFPAVQAAVVTTAPQAKSLTYNGKAQELASAGEAEGGTMAYALGGDAQTAPTGGWGESVPSGTDAGTYYVWYMAVGDAAHGDSEPACVEATIAKADPVVTAPQAKSLTYNGKAQALASAGKASGGAMRYSLDGKSYSASVPKATKAGTYTVRYKVAGDANHKDSAAKSVKATIAKAAASVTAVPKGKSLKYNGKAQALASAGKASGGAMRYSLDGKSYSASVPKATRAGTYTVWYKVAGDANHKDSAAKSVKATIAKAEPAVPATGARAHVQGSGWAEPTQAGAIAGTTGRSLRMEALALTLAKSDVRGGIEYRGHVQGAGWETSWARDGKTCGTVGQSKRLEAVQIRLYGDMAKQFNVYYRVHSQRYGWLAWAKSGEKAGTEGMSLRAEAVQVVLVRKGAKAPAKTFKGATQAYGKAFIRR